jgi:MFS transporter, FSR family, fosmidomycin resistance protein
MAIAARILPVGIDRRGIGVLAFGHLSVDSCQGLVPALMPFLIDARGYTYAQAGSLLLFSSLGSSLLQPLLGIFADRIHATWLMWTGALIAAVGMGSSGLMPTYYATGAALMVGSVGVAMFHPEAVRFASYVSAASGQRGTGMSFFAVGGVAGWALGPLLLTASVLAVGLRGTTLVAVVPFVAATLLLMNGRHLEAFRPRTSAAAQVEGAGRSHWGVFALAAGSASTRTGLQFGLQAYVPLYIWQVLGTSEGIGNASASVLMVAGAFGTLIGGRMADRIGFRPVVVWSLAAVVPLVLILTTAPTVGVFVLMALIGISMEANFYPLVVIAQSALPRNVGFASGVMLGLSIGAGALMTAGLGVVADAYGLEAALRAVAGLGLIAFALAAAIPRDRSA